VACARTLVQAGHKVTLFEREAAPGGRMASIDTAFGRFDSGAQYFTVRDPRFALALEATPNLCRPWSANLVRVLDAHGRVAEAALPGLESHWVAQPGMDALVAHWAAPLGGNLVTEHAGHADRARCARPQALAAAHRGAKTIRSMCTRASTPCCSPCRLRAPARCWATASSRPPSARRSSRCASRPAGR
jgi:glycine/D-amino acid oxidase-like deaminating enzyme